VLAALEQCWPPFVLVAGLLLIGLVAGEDGLFDAAAGFIERLPGSPLALFAACCLALAVTTALLNLDTAAVFLTPVAIGVARKRGVSEAPFLYGSLFMANASSLYLPGSNLTNLLVLSSRGISGGTFLARMLPAALAATLVTAVGVACLHRRALCGSGRSREGSGRGGTSSGGCGADAGPLRWAEAGSVRGADAGRVRRSDAGPGARPRRAPQFGVGLAGVIAAAVLMVVLRNAALPVLAVGIAATVWRLCEGRVSSDAVWRRLGAPILLGLFLLAVALGGLARATGFPGHAVASLGVPATAAVAALSTVLINNLPAAVLLSAGHVAHPTALLIGLDVGPNLAVSGSLSALLWWRSASAMDARPSALVCSAQGILLAPLAIVAALALSAAVHV
jgi:arsenical pump membrane protein